MIELLCIRIYFNIFVRNSSMILHVILPLCTLPFACPLLYLPWSITPCLRDTYDSCFWNYMAKITSNVWVPKGINICVSYPFAPRIFTVDINWKRNIFSVELRLSNTYLSCPVSLIAWLIITKRIVTTLATIIMQWHICSYHNSHICLIIFYLNIVMIKQFNDSFDVWISCDGILFAVIRKKGVNTQHAVCVVLVLLLNISMLVH